jgi:hypothetical protein
MVVFNGLHHGHFWATARKQVPAATKKQQYKIDVFYVVRAEKL